MQVALIAKWSKDLQTYHRERQEMNRVNHTHKREHSKGIGNPDHIIQNQMNQSVL